MQRGRIPLPVALFLASWAGTAAADPPDQAIEGRLGTLVPSQVLDGANLHLRLGWRMLLGGGFWLHTEAGADRATVTGVTTVLPAPGGAVALRADQSTWTVPVLAGVAWQLARDDGPGVGLTAAGGVAWRHATQTDSVVGGPDLGQRSEAGVDYLVMGRLDLTWALRGGEIVFGGGWQQVFRPGPAPATGDVRASGLFLEGGWRVLY